MDTTEEERSLFDHVTCNISASVDEVSIPVALAPDLIEQAEVEVERADQLKASRMKEIAFKKWAVLEEIFSCTLIEIESQAAQHKIMILIDSGNIEPAELLADMDNHIVKAKEEAHRKKEVLDKVEKWMAACEEDATIGCLFQYYDIKKSSFMIKQDQSRYNVSRGAHLNLKRAEKARMLVGKVPALVDSLIAKTRAWEQDCHTTFTYDGVPLLAMLDEYMMLRHDREEEKRRLRDYKKFHEQIKEQETPFGSTLGPARSLGTKKVVCPRANGSDNRRLSLNSHQNGSRSTTKDGKRDHSRTVAPVNYVSISKEHIPSTP